MKIDKDRVRQRRTSSARRGGVCTYLCHCLYLCLSFYAWRLAPSGTGDQLRLSIAEEITEICPPVRFLRILNFFCKRKYAYNDYPPRLAFVVRNGSPADGIYRDRAVGLKKAITDGHGHRINDRRDAHQVFPRAHAEICVDELWVLRLPSAQEARPFMAFYCASLAVLQLSSCRVC